MSTCLCRAEASDVYRAATKVCDDLSATLISSDKIKRKKGQRFDKIKRKKRAICDKIKRNRLSGEGLDGRWEIGVTTCRQKGYGSELGGEKRIRPYSI